MEYREFTGLRNDRPVERLSPADLSVAQNVDIDNSGGIALRTGFTLVPTVAAGAKHSLWSDDSALWTDGWEGEAYYVQGSSLYVINPNLSSSAVMTGLTPNAPMFYKRVLDRVYFSNGAQTGIFENGIVRSWGLPVPPPPGVIQTVGAMLAGTYQIATTYVRNDGQESGATLAERIDVIADGVGIQVSLPASTDATVVAKNVYLSTRNGEVLYLAMVVPNSQTSALYSNDTSELNLPLITQFKSAPPPGQVIGHYRGVMYVAANDVLYPSEDFNYELFDLRKYLPFDDRITMFATLDGVDDGGIFIGTARSCGILVGKGPSDFQYVPKVNYGAIPGTMVQVDGSLYGDDSARARLLPVWLTSQGVCAGMPGMEIRNLTRTMYGIPATGRGASLFVPGSNRLIVSSNY